MRTLSTGPPANQSAPWADSKMMSTSLVLRRDAEARINNVPVYRDEADPVLCIGPVAVGFINNSEEINQHKKREYTTVHPSD